MPIEDYDEEEERRARDGYDLARIRLNRLLQNPVGVISLFFLFLGVNNILIKFFQDKPVIIPERKAAAKPKPPPEFVRNVVGSSAAAGSAEFHIYRNNRRKEMNRLNFMEKEFQDKKADEEYEAKRNEVIRAEEAKVEKNRLKRQKRKQRMRDNRKNKKVVSKLNSITGYSNCTFLFQFFLHCY